MLSKKWITLIFYFVFTACNNDQPQPTQVNIIPLEGDPMELEEIAPENLGPIDFKKIDAVYETGKAIQEADLVNGNTQFAIELFTAINKPDENMIISPYSITTAFGMVYGTSEGATVDQIQKTFHFPEKNVQSFHRALGDLNDKILENTKGAINIRVANKIWMATGYGIKEEFNELTKAFYQTTTGIFNSPADGADKINAWAAQKTNDKIKDILKPDNLEDVRFALTNAIYFYGAWETEFDKEKTRKYDFFLSNENAIKTDFMSEKLEAVYIYDYDKNCEILELFYKEGKASMLLVMPNKEATLAEFIQNMNEEDYKKWTSSESDEGDVEKYKGKIAVSIPKFKIETPTLSLGDAFQEKLGMKGPFERANFSKMTRLTDLVIGGIYHKAMIEVNEQGTEAAAVTVVTMKGRGVGGAPHFVANRPFLYFIKENTTNSILFMGQVVDPSE